MEAEKYTLRCIPSSQALYINKGCAQSLGGLVVSACATTHQQWGLMFPIPFLGPTATEGWWGAALLQATALGLACSLTTDSFSAAMARVHPAAEVSREFSQSSTVVPALHSSGLVLSLPAEGCAGAGSTAHLGRVWV